MCKEGLPPFGLVEVHIWDMIVSIQLLPVRDLFLAGFCNVIDHGATVAVQSEEWLPHLVISFLVDDDRLGL